MTQQERINRHIGETVIANNGMSMSIIRYRQSTDIDIQFKDGTIVTNKTYTAFKKGCIRNPNIRKQVKVKEYSGVNITNREGETNIARNGLKMTLIKYKSAIDIDIQFEDGTIVTNKTYRRFKTGHIKHPKVRTNSLNQQNTKKYIGQTSMSKDGYQMKIIGYRGRGSVDIQFEDGLILKNQFYSRFINGYIQRSDNAIVEEQIRQSRVGQTVVAKNGLQATIIKYNKFREVYVKFEDGVEVGPISYNNFKSGVIKHPTISASRGKTGNNKIRKDLEKQYVGYTLTMKNGLKATITKYVRSRDITVVFENGAIREHVRVTDFKRGTIQLKARTRIDSERAQSRVGEQKVNNQGYLMTLIKYNKCSDITVQFEDGKIVEHRSYSNFLKGSIRYPSYTNCTYTHESLLEAMKSKRIGETSRAHNGMLMTIIDYNKATDITIQFENGIVKKHVKYNAFKKGEVSIKQNKRIEETKEPKHKLSELRVGDTIIANNGMQMKVIEYYRYSNITVQFEDGTIVYNKAYGDFKRGAIKNPNAKTHKCKTS